jgi:hypothetical protein
LTNAIYNEVKAFLNLVNLWKEIDLYI